MQFLYHESISHVFRTDSIRFDLVRFNLWGIGGEVGFFFLCSAACGTHVQVDG